MPGFVKTPKDEARWAKAKEAAGKEAGKGTDSYWRLSNYIFHKMGKTEQDVKIAKELEKSLLKPSIPSAMKMPKAKSMPKPGDKPSLFYKKEDFENVKQPSIENLRVFLERNRSKIR
jgi:hypothetical protein